MEFPFVRLNIWSVWQKNKLLWDQNVLVSSALFVLVSSLCSWEEQMGGNSFLQWGASLKSFNNILHIFKSNSSSLLLILLWNNEFFISWGNVWTFCFLSLRVRCHSWDETWSWARAVNAVPVPFLIQTHSILHCQNILASHFALTSWDRQEN